MSTSTSLASLPKERMSERQHITELDGLRGIAILMVFLFHYIAVNDGGSLGYLIFTHTVKSLWCGVDLFFVLSGFLITGILLDTKSTERYFSNFFVRRALRIFPLYFMVSAIVFLVLPALSVTNTTADQTLLNNQIWVWLYAVNLKVSQAGFTPFLGDKVYLSHLWSLAVEEHFYLAWPFVVYFLSQRTLRYVCITCLIGALSLRVVLLVVAAPPLASYTFTLCRIDSLAAGALLSLSMRETKARHSVWPTLPLLLMAIVSLCFLWVWRGGLPLEDHVARTFGYTFLAIAFSGIVKAAVTVNESHPIQWLLNMHALRFLGKYSYGMYMIHVAMIPSFRVLLTTVDLQNRLGLPYAVAGSLRVMLVFAACLTLAFISWTFIERFPLKLKRYFLA